MSIRVRNCGWKRNGKQLWRTAILASLGVGVGALLLLPALLHGQQQRSARGDASSENSGPNSGDVARGKYLVEQVAMCGQCHTPRDENGVIDRSQWLQGGAVPWVPAQPKGNWPLLAPRIGGTPPASDEEMVKLLTTGIWTNGTYLRFPMMPFRMNEADAKAVIAYLKTPSAWK